MIHKSSSHPVTRNSARPRRGFTLVELLVVVAIIATLLGILVPSLSHARQTAQRTVCGSNIRQLHLANTAYTIESRGHYVLAAEDIYTGTGGTKRWHGQRAASTVSVDPTKNHFDPALGPLVSYLGEDGKVKGCPTFRDVVLDGKRNAFEEGTGGFGYNDSYIGGRRDLFGSKPASATHSARLSEVRDPAQTVMFTDAAIAQSDAQGTYLTEYSFAEPPHFVLAGGKLTPARPTPSIHFRHLDHATVAWVDAHVSIEELTLSGASVYGLTAATVRQLNLGWFGPDNNDLFDLN